MVALVFMRTKKSTEVVESDPAVTLEPTPTATPEIGNLTPTPTATVSVSPNPAATPNAAAIEKARASAKGRLFSAFAALKSYYYQNHRYTTDLDALGLQPMPPMNYKMGFLREFNSTDLDQYERPTIMNTDKYIGRKITVSESFQYTPEADKISLDSLSGFCKHYCTATENDFEIILAYPLGNDRYDVWTINSNKELELVQDGLK